MDIVVEVEDPKQTAYIYACSGSTIQVLAPALSASLVPPSMHAQLAGKGDAGVLEASSGDRLASALACRTFCKR